MFQALGLVAAGFLLHWLLNRGTEPAAGKPKDKVPEKIPEDDSDNQTPPTLIVYTNAPYSVIEYAPESSTMAAYVVAKYGSPLLAPNGSNAYQYKTKAEAVARADKLKESDSMPEGPVGPDDLPDPIPTPDLPGLPGSGGGIGGSRDSLPTMGGGSIGGVSANDADFGGRRY